VGRYWPADALEFKLANRLDADGVLDRHQHARADQNLSGLGFVAQSGRDVGHGPDGGVVEASLEADRTQRRISVCDADAEPDIVPKPTPFLGQGVNAAAHFEGHQHGLQRRVLDRHRIVEDHHSPAYRSRVPLYLMMISPMAAW